MPLMAMLVLPPACSPAAVAPERAIEVTDEALVGRCFQLLDSAAAPLAGPFWSGVVRLDTASATRMGSMRFLPGTEREDLHDVTSLASEALTADTLAFSSHWSRERDRLRLVRSTGFRGEAVSLTAAGSRLSGERSFFSDVVVPGAARRVERVHLVPRPCPASAVSRPGSRG